MYLGTFALSHGTITTASHHLFQVLEKSRRLPDQARLPRQAHMSRVERRDLNLSESAFFFSRFSLSEKIRLKRCRNH